MTDPIPAADATKVLGDLGEVPRVTKTVDTKPAAAAAPGALVDANGVAFNKALHACDRNGNPMRRVDGGWQLKRGNGARKNAGKPAAGGVSYLAPPRGTEGAPSPAAATDASTSSSTPPPAGSDFVHTPEIEAAPTLTEEDYESTARGIERGMFAIARLQFGEAWREDDAERSEWTSCLRRLWHHYQLPRLGVLVEFVILLCATIAKRRADAATREGWNRIRAWLGLDPVITDQKPGDQKPGEETKAA